MAGTPTRRPGPVEDGETSVLRAVAWVMLFLGVAALLLFARAPDFQAHPGLVLLGTTGVVGCGVLRVLARLLASPPPQ